MRPMEAPARSGTPTSVHLACLLTVAPLIGVSDAAAQQVEGRVVEAGTDTPITAVQVWLRSAAGDDLKLTFTTEDGRFTIMPDSAGDYRIEARRQGYETAVSHTFRYDGTSPDPIEVRMARRPIAIDGVEVEAQRSVRLEHQATYAGLHRRAETAPSVGRDRVYLREELERDDFRTIAEYVRQRNVPGLGRSGVIMEGGRAPPRGMRAGCVPHIYWVGFEAPVDVSHLPDQFLSLLVRDMEGIELYGDAREAPLGVRPVNAEAGGFCGLIVLWPRRVIIDSDGGDK